MSCCALNRGFLCSLLRGHVGDHTYLPRPDAVCGISWLNDKEKKLSERDTTLQDRQGKYGDFDVLARCIQSLKNFYRQQPNWARLTFRQQEAMDMGAVKQARILCGGDPDYQDNWHDWGCYGDLGAGWKA